MARLGASFLAAPVMYYHHDGGNLESVSRSPDDFVGRNASWVPVILNISVEGGALGVGKLNSADADSETPRRLPIQPMYVLHRTGCSQAEDQLLREGRQRPDSRRRIDFRHTSGAGRLDASASAAARTSSGARQCWQFPELFWPLYSTASSRSEVVMS